nr:type I secretion system permease/ATPase [uncultured Cohaesibacter sp.]
MPRTHSKPQKKSVHFFKNTGWIWLGVGLLSAIINILMLTGPFFMLQVYDRVLSSNSVPTLVVLGIIAITLYSFYGILDILRSRILLRIGQYVDARMSESVYRASSTAPIITGSNAASVRPVTDLDKIRQFLSSPGPAALFDSPWMPFYLFIVYLFHPILGLIGLVGAIIIGILIALNEWLSRTPIKDAAREAAVRHELVESSRSNAEVSKAMGMFGDLQLRWSRNNEKYLLKQKIAADRNGFFTSATKTIRLMLQSTILGVGAWLAIQHEITAGTMVAGSIMVSRALSPIELAISQWRAFVGARQSHAHLIELMSNMPDHDVELELPIPQKMVTVEQASCAPVGSRKAFVAPLSMRLNAGQALGIIGPSGSGKSTLAKCMVGIIPALSGAIRFDGSELSHWAEDKHKHIIGYLPQDLQLFHGTVAQNIARFDKDASSEAIIEAAQLADLHDMISRLPDGYDTIIGPAGYSLSGGQMQRIALARALYGNPFLVVLDEPNSSLDNQGEGALTKALFAMKKKGSVVIVIAHRPSALAAVDYVLCLDEGQVKAIGPKNEVLAKVLSPVAAKGVA